MSDESTNFGGKRRGSGFIWLLVLLAVLLVWWFWRPPASHHHGAQAVGAADRYEGADADEIIVDFKDDDSAARVAEVGARFGIDLQLVSKQSEDERMYRAKVDPARRDELIDQIAKLPDVEIVEPDATYQLLDDPGDKWKGFPNDPEYKYQWHFGQIGMPEAWKLADGEGVIVAVIDTGVAYENYKKFHRVPDLAETKFTKGYDFVGNTEHADDDHAHGTHVAGTIAQSTNNGIGVAGIAHKATIMPLKVLSASGSGSVAAIGDAIRYAADNGAKVINMSLGGRFPSRVLEKAVKYAHDKGVVVVCAAGNDGSKRVSYPAAYPGAVAVAATQYDETTTFYSNYGKEIDVAAPGGNTQVDQNGDGRPDGVLQNTIVTGDPSRDGYFAFMGTSMASPHVAGVAALVISQGVTNPDAVEEILKTTARAPKGPKLDRDKYGAGIIDAPAAIRKAREGTRNTSLGLGALVLAAAAATARRRRLGMALGIPGMGVGAVFIGTALIPLAAVLFFHQVRRARWLLVGLAAGVAAHALFQLAAHTTTVSPLWLAINAAVSALLAYAVARRD
jgi:serine protease